MQQKTILEYYLFSKLRPISVSIGKRVRIWETGYSAKVIFCTAGSLLYPGQTRSLGVPRVLNILFNWSTSDLPVNRGSIAKNSAKIQPTDHMSTGVEYSCKRFSILAKAFRLIAESADQDILLFETLNRRQFEKVWAINELCQDFMSKGRSTKIVFKSIHTFECLDDIQTYYTNKQTLLSVILCLWGYCSLLMLIR